MLLHFVNDVINFIFLIMILEPKMKKHNKLEKIIIHQRGKKKKNCYSLERSQTQNFQGSG